MVKRKWVEGAVLDITGVEGGDIDALLASMMKTCGRCSITTIDAKQWGDTMLCETCYEVARSDRCAEFNTWLESVGLKECAFCGKERINPHEFHFDHVDMFAKEVGVGEMLFSGSDMETIKGEVQKCQLLCVGCHAIVTKAEQGLGFIYHKTYGKRRENGLDKEEYMMVMPVIYEAIKRMRGREAGLGGK